MKKHRRRTKPSEVPFLVDISMIANRNELVNTGLRENRCQVPFSSIFA